MSHNYDGRWRAMVENSSRRVRNNILMDKLHNTSKAHASLCTPYAHFTTQHFYHLNAPSKVICWVTFIPTLLTCYSVYLVPSDMGVWELLTTLYPGYASHSGPITWQPLAQYPDLTRVRIGPRSWDQVQTPQDPSRVFISRHAWLSGQRMSWRNIPRFSFGLNFKPP